MNTIERARQLITNPFASFELLTPDEREALKWASRGYSYSMIAKVMGISGGMANYYLRQGTLKVGMSKADLTGWVFKQLLMLLGGADET